MSARQPKKFYDGPLLPGLLHDDDGNYDPDAQVAADNLWHNAVAAATRKGLLRDFDWLFMELRQLIQICLDKNPHREAEIMEKLTECTLMGLSIFL